MNNKHTNTLKKIETFKGTKQETVLIASLKFATYQSEINLKKVEEYSKRFDEKLLRPIDVSFREGQFWVVDGQHRVKLCELVGRDQIQARIHFGLTYQEESLLYFELNNSKNAPNKSVADKWHALLEAGDIHIASLVSVLRQNGVNPFQSIKGNGKLPLDTFYRIYSFANGSYLLDRTLRLINLTWPQDNKRFFKFVVSGVYLFVKYYDNEFCDSEFVKKMSLVTPNIVLQVGHDKKSYTSTGYTPYGLAVLDIYNRSRRNKLENVIPTNDETCKSERTSIIGNHNLKTQ